MYCDCFAQARYCTSACRCIGCANVAVNEPNLQRARTLISKRNPHAFGTKVSSRRGTRRHAQGCKCSKSRCQKRYCECFHAGVQCTSACQCQNCCNGRESFGELPELDRDGDLLFDGISSLDSLGYLDDCGVFGGGASDLPMPTAPRT